MSIADTSNKFDSLRFNYETRLSTYKLEQTPVNRATIKEAGKHFRLFLEEHQNDLYKTQKPSLQRIQQMINESFPKEKQLKLKAKIAAVLNILDAPSPPAFFSFCAS